MRPLNEKTITSQNAATTLNGPAIDTRFVYSVSVMGVASGSNLAGTIKLQASNDAPAGNSASNPPFVPTNWVDIANATVSLTSSGGVYLIPKTDLSYQWIRTVYTSTATGVQTIAPVADSGGSLAGKYFLLQDTFGNKYAIWFKVSGSGSAPSVSGYTPVEQDIVTNDTAATIGAALATTIAALNSTNSFTTSGTTTVTVTNKAAGSFVPVADGNTGFAFATTTPNGTVNAQIKTIGL